MEHMRYRMTAADPSKAVVADSVNMSHSVGQENREEAQVQHSHQNNFNKFENGGEQGSSSDKGSRLEDQEYPGRIDNFTDPGPKSVAKSVGGTTTIK